MPSSRLFWSLSALLLCLLAALALRVGLGSSFFNDHALFASNESDRQRFHLVPILCFHNVDGPGPYSVSRQEFRAYMESIRRAGVQVVPLRTLYQHARENRLFDQPSMVITIDDDYKNIARVAAPILREYGYPATFYFYISEITDDPREGTSWADLQRLHREGFDIQNHSWTHTRFHEPEAGESRTQYSKRLEKEIIASREKLERNVPGLQIWSFAYPFGYHSEGLHKRVFEAGYDLALTTDARPVDVSQPFHPIFDRYTIQKRLVRDPEAMFRRQLGYALTPYGSAHSAALQPR